MALSQKPVALVHVKMAPAAHAIITHYAHHQKGFADFLCIAACRAYTAYMRLSFPSEAFTPVPASGATTGVKSLLQQVKSGIHIPKPVQPEANAPEANAIPHTVQALLS